MKRHVWIVPLGMLLLVTLVVLAFAAEKPAQQQPAASCPMMSGGAGPGMTGQGGMMMGKDGMMGGGMMGCPMCGGMMGRTSMLAIGNNLYVLAGNKILKYDANLNLVKEAEIKWDMEGMMKMHQKMMEEHGMMQNRPMMENHPNK
jgi:hypothetical protein